MYKRLRRIAVLILIVLVLTFNVACNPKPVVEDNLEPRQMVKVVEGYERIYQLSEPFTEGVLFQGLTLLTEFLGKEISPVETNALFMDERYSYRSLLDFIHLLDQKELHIIPTYGTLELIQSEIDAGRVVLAQYYYSGASLYTAIFYGYTAEELLSFDIATLEEKAVAIEQFNQRAVQNKPELYLYHSEQLPYVQAEREASELYFSLSTKDAFYKQDKEKYRQAVQKIEDEQLIDQFLYLYAFYYIFIEQLPEKAEVSIEKLLVEAESPFNLELAFMLHVLQDNPEAAERYMDGLEYTFLQEVTLYRLGQYYVTQEAYSQAKFILDHLLNKNPDYPGLQELIRQLEQYL